MQESRVEAAIFKEVTYKLSDSLQHEQFMAHEAFEPYAEQYAPDATPDEIDSLLCSFPVVTHGPRGHLERIHYSSLVGLFGELALSAGDNQELRDHSLWQISEAETIQTIHGGKLSLPASSYHMIVHARLGNIDKALDLAKQHAAKDPAQEMSSAERILQDLTAHNRDTAPAVIQLGEAVQTAKSAWEAQTGKPTYSKVVSDSMVKLYATNPAEVTAFCEEYKLHTDLVLAMQAHGESVPLKLLKQAEHSVPATFIEKLQLMTALVQGNRRKGIAELGKASNLGILARDYKDSLAAIRAKHQASLGNYDNALLATRGIKKIAPRMEATTSVRDAIIATGDVELYRTLTEVHNIQYGSFAYYAVPMCMRKGDYDTAIQIIQAEKPLYHINAWLQFVKGYIDYEVANDRGTHITADTITGYLERAEDPSNLLKQSHSYAEVYGALREHGLMSTAHALKEHVKQRDDEMYKVFRSYIRTYIKKDLLASGNWLEAMHGDYLSNPQEGLRYPSDLLLVMGGIHRERLRRKQ